MSQNTKIDSKKSITKNDIKEKSITENKNDTESSIIFKRLILLYINNKSKLPNYIIPELEIRFGTKNIKNITKNEFNNVISTLISKDFILKDEQYYLKIISDNTDNIRTEINGLNNIQAYCKSDNIMSMIDIENIKFIEKKYFVNKEKTIYPLDFDDYNFRVSYQLEKYYNPEDDTIKKILSTWETNKKIFRYIKRLEFVNPNFPFKVHMSIVKMSKRIKSNFVKVFNIKDSEVFKSFENFEIEIELDNDKVSIDSKTNEEILYNNFKEIIKYILSGIQNTNYPIKISELNNVENNYLMLTKETDYNTSLKLNNKDFIGPSSNTLMLQNLLEFNNINETNNSIPNIRKNYTVTDKADGARKLLYIDPTGKIYLIPMLMTFEFTGCYTNEKDLFNTIIDGEHILHDKFNNFINLYAAFDVYYINTKNVTYLPLINTDEEKSETKPQNYRLNILSSIIKKINIKSIVDKKTPSITIKIKKFYSNNIFDACSLILKNSEKNVINYNIDGLIFTPSNTGVASNTVGKIAPHYKVTWNESFKWKPPEFNTIDFLIKFERNDFNSINIKNLHNKGYSSDTACQIKSYITLILHVGFDEKYHGYINPFNDLINQNYTITSQEKYKSEYKPCRFYPTDPSDENAGLCNIMCKLDENNNPIITTEEGDIIEDNTIVEFKYNINNENLWRWIPIRIRHDKTSELRSGIRNFGNAYHVANSNWHSIHYPVTEKNITTGENINIQLNDDDVYYNKVSNTTSTRSLRDFHNLYVKNNLYSLLSSPGNILIDYACGKGGDIPKWIQTKLKFILGIDLSKDNIENRLDGACARYLNYYKKSTTLPDALFLNGNSSNNIKNGDAFFNSKNKEIINALFGEGTKNEITLGKLVYKNYGICKNGFNISSIQFAIHYMFENELILNEFIKNVSQCTALNGYFIGCCYDGKKIFKMLSELKLNESTSLYNKNNLIWKITKKYSSNVFEDDDSCLGYPIEVYQESINKTFIEYLVNFDYFIRIMENYGFVKLSSEECLKLEISKSIDSFEFLYKKMLEQTKSNPNLLLKLGSSLNMTEEEKKISFLNNYFIFKKVRSITSDANPMLKEKLSKKEFDNSQHKIDEIDKDLEKLQEKEFLEQQEENKKQIQQPQDTKIEEPIKKSQEKSKIRLSIDEKLAAAEKRKIEREKLALEKKASKKSSNK